MTAETAKKFKALEAQAATLLNVFTSAGYEPVAPAILQPADIFLNQIGESLRNRTYVFTAPDGEELCLRPDLTVPVCRLYLERNGNERPISRYCYNGPAFRFQPSGVDAARPREFRQAGLEYIGGQDECKADAEVITLITRAVRAAGLEKFSIRFGDLALFHALIDALEMPERWRQRLKHKFWRPQEFRQLLVGLTDKDTIRNTNGQQTILTKLIGVDKDTAMQLVRYHLESKGIPHMGERGLDEITERLLDQRDDMQAQPLPKSTASVIENYLAISGQPRAAGARIADLAHAVGINLDQALHAYHKRIDLFCDKENPVNSAVFCAEYGRDLEYYTGFVFQIEVPELKMPAGQIAGGGRYNKLIGEIDHGNPAPAIGSAIHTERLLAAVQGERYE